MEKETFTITTNRETAEEIKNQFISEERYQNAGLSLVLRGMYHEEGYSVVQIEARDEKIDPADIFRFGYRTARNAILYPKTPQILNQQSKI